MKLLKISLFSLLFCSLAHAGNPVEPPVEKKSPLLFHKQNYPAFAATRLPADTGLTNQNWQRYQIERKLHSGKVLTITGIAMFAGGTALTFAGVGFVNVANNAYGNATGAITGAVMSYIIGGGCLVASIPITIVGAIRWSQGSFEKRMYVQLQGTAGPNGMGMKMTF